MKYFFLAFLVISSLASATAPLQGPNETSIFINQSNLVDVIKPPIDPYQLAGSTMVLYSVPNVLFVDYKDASNATRRFAAVFTPNSEALRTGPEDLLHGLTLIKNKVIEVRGSSNDGNIVCSQNFYTFLLGGGKYTLEDSTLRRLGGDRVLPSVEESVGNTNIRIGKQVVSCSGDR